MTDVAPIYYLGFPRDGSGNTNKFASLPETEDVWR